MTLEKTPLQITSADKHPRESSISIGAIQMPVKDAIAALVFAATILGSVSMIRSAPSAPEETIRESSPTDEIETLKKTCTGRLVSDGKGNFSCEPIQKPSKPSPKNGTQDYFKKVRPEDRVMNSRTVPV